MTAKLEAAQDITAKLEAAHLDLSKSRQGSPPKTPHPGTWMPDSFDAIGITDKEIRRCLADFNKMYKDSDKYSGERYHFMSRKFDTFKDRCRRMSIPYVLWARAFPTMLIDEAEDYYVSKLSKEPRTIEELVSAVRDRFENDTNLSAYRIEWCSMTFRQVIGENPGKACENALSRSECRRNASAEWEGAGASSTDASSRIEVATKQLVYVRWTSAGWKLMNAVSLTVSYAW